MFDVSLLTKAERRTLLAILDGLTNKAIANHTLRSVHTIKHHVTSLFDKTGTHSRLELGMFATNHNLRDNLKENL